MKEKVPDRAIEHTVSYLGDGAYVACDDIDGGLILWTSDGISPTNEVYLGPSELKSLHNYLKRHFNIP